MPHDRTPLSAADVIVAVLVAVSALASVASLLVGILTFLRT